MAAAWCCFCTRNSACVPPVGVWFVPCIWGWPALVDFVGQISEIPGESGLGFKGQGVGFWPNLEFTEREGCRL